MVSLVPCLCIKVELSHNHNANEQSPVNHSTAVKETLNAVFLLVVWWFTL